jgi:hypothetical protein
MAKLEFNNIDEMYDFLRIAHATLPQDVIDAAYKFRNFCLEIFHKCDHNHSIEIRSSQKIGPGKYLHSTSEPSTVYKIFKITSKQETYSVYHNDTETSRSLTVEWAGFQHKCQQELPRDKPRKKAKAKNGSEDS